MHLSRSRHRRDLLSLRAQERHVWSLLHHTLLAGCTHRCTAAACSACGKKKDVSKLRSVDWSTRKQAFLSNQKLCMCKTDSLFKGAQHSVAFVAAMAAAPAVETALHMPPEDGISSVKFSKSSNLLLVSSWDKARPQSAPRHAARIRALTRSAAERAAVRCRQQHHQVALSA